MNLNLNSELVILDVAGEDAATYLQGQLTNDIYALQTKPWQLSAHLNTKGRIIASFLITAANSNHYYLLTSRSLADTILPRLKMFIFRSKVKCEISSQDVWLANTASEAAHGFELVPGQFVNIGVLPDGGQFTVDGNLWHQLLVDNGIPMIYPGSGEKIIPQQANYDLIGGINFKKGCYTGQAIVARTHYLGKVKRRMVQFSCEVQPQLGQTVVSPKLDNQEIGFIVDYYSKDNLFYGLASLQLDCVGEAYLIDNQKAQLICKPFSVEDLTSQRD